MKKALVHMAYYSTEAEIIGETEKSYKVSMPSMRGVDIVIPPFTTWVPKESVELIKESL